MPVRGAGRALSRATLYLLPFGRPRRHGRDPLFLLKAALLTFDEMRLLTKVDSWWTAGFPAFKGTGSSVLDTGNLACPVRGSSNGEIWPTTDNPLWSGRREGADIRRLASALPLSTSKRSSVHPISSPRSRGSIDQGRIVFTALLVLTHRRAAILPTELAFVQTFCFLPRQLVQQDQYSHEN